MNRICACGKSEHCGKAGCYYLATTRVIREAEKIKLEWDKPAETGISKVLDAGNFLEGTGVIIKTPNGDEFRFRYDKDHEAIMISKMSDSMRTGAINIQPGGGSNVILIK